MQQGQHDQIHSRSTGSASQLSTQTRIWTLKQSGNNHHNETA